ncbi:septum formation family protein [Catenuloplanes atrovinosus]|uniref:Septum formation-related domain-containing protein n=1 Tax=Catenuloplanes atrovinosus TaxID=137266 RepID=A0AAE3YLM3_9ACTN|nr:septum formation family protein [Catenuloplanes atrovinosus]MDR7275242.1 hypothetical protein [Catenuloplanes atrovinosus]
MSLTEAAWGEEKDRYGGGARDWAPVPHRISGLAVAGVVAGVASIVAVLLIGLASLFFAVPAAGFGLAAVIQVRRGLRRGLGLAVSPLLLTVVWAVLLAVGLGGSAAAAKRYESVTGLRAGDCFDRTEGDPERPFIPAGVERRDCTAPHDAELLGWATTDDQRYEFRAYPGEALLSEWAAAGCRRIHRDVIIDPPTQPAGAHLRWYVPRETEWAKGGRAMSCYLSFDGERPSRPARLTSDRVTEVQLRFLVAVLDIRYHAPIALADGPIADRRTAAAKVAAGYSLLPSQLGRGPWPAAAEPAIARLAEESTEARDRWMTVAETRTDESFTEALAAVGPATPTDAELAARAALGLTP